ncbi:MAG TPA: discoidin domain-containing protein, partial [Sphingobacterium sp.]|nr:discoidin domain-containing protein [Sphingobacterium sp.]
VYNISQSPWKNGRGDMVKAFMEASHRNGMKFGVYLSAWDRNDIRYGTAAYADAYREQLRELMTGYGPLFTSWHDGANGGDGYYGGKNEKRQIDRATYYEWEEKTWPIVRQYQPMAMIFSDIGWDMRWVGNEKGFAPETSWATITPRTKDGVKPSPGTHVVNLESGDRHGKYWIPAECDVPLRPGWFYHKNQDNRVKTPDQLFTIYLQSVGRGACMNIGLAPMPEGFLHQSDVQTLAAFGRKISRTFVHDLASGASAKASSNRGTHAAFSVKNIFDNDRYSYYAPDDAVLNPIVEITLSKAQTFDIIRLRENIKLGQRLDSVVVEVFQNDDWKRLASATSIGANRLVKLSNPVTAARIRLQLFAPVTPTLSDFALFKEYQEAFSFEDHKPALHRLGNAAFTVKPLTVWQAVDGNPNSFGQLNNADKEIILELHEPVSALGYLPRQDGENEGLVLKYAIYTSEDNRTWVKSTEGEFSNIQANPTEQILHLKKELRFKYIKFVAKEVVGNSLTIAEFNVYQ